MVPLSAVKVNKKVLRGAVMIKKCPVLHRATLITK